MAKPTTLRAAPAVKVPRRPTPLEAVPRVVCVPTLDNHLEIMTRAIFQAGLSWAMITARWDAFYAAFEGFEVRTVAAYGDFDLERLMTTDQIIHSPKKITGTIANARALIALQRDFGSVSAFIAAHGSYIDLFRDARSRFAFMGDLNCYYWLFRTAGPVPLFEDWIARQERDHPRMREMVMIARADGITSERADF